MLHSRLPLMCGALLCAVNVQALVPVAARSAFLNVSSSTTSSSQQGVGASSTATFPSSSQMSASSSSSIYTSSSVTTSQSSSSSLYTTSISSSTTGDPFAFGNIEDGPSPVSSASAGTPVAFGNIEDGLIPLPSAPAGDPFAFGNIEDGLSSGPASSATTDNYSTSHGATSKVHLSTPHNSSTVLYSPTKSNGSNRIRPTIMATSNATTSQSTSSCIPYVPGQAITVWEVVPNTNTVTLTIYGNQSNTFTTTPEWTPPITCQPLSSFPTSLSGTSSVLPLEFSRTILPITTQGLAPIPTAQTTTIIVTSKNPVTQITTQTNPSFPVETEQSIPPSSSSPTTTPWFPFPFSFTFPSVPSSTGESTAAATSGGDSGGFFSNIGGSGGVATTLSGVGGQSVPPPSPTTVVDSGVTLVVGPSSIVIGTLTITPSSGETGVSDSVGSGSDLSGSSEPPASLAAAVSAVLESSGGSDDAGIAGILPSITSDGSGFTTVVTENGLTFTVNPSQVIGPATVISVPTPTVGSEFTEGPAPTPTVVDGVTVAVGSGVAVVGGSTYAIGSGAPQQTVVVNNENVSIGPGGVGLADATITPPASLPTNVVVYGGQVFSVVGGSVGVFDGHSFTFTGDIPLYSVFNGDTITAGPSGFSDGTLTLGGPDQTVGTQYGLAGGIAISEIGSTVALIDGTSLTVGPGAPQTQVTIDGHTISAGPSGLTIDGTNGVSTTLDFPFNPTTQAVTAGGITVSKIGPSLVNIGGTTFTIGPGATPTTDIYEGHTISIGSGGIGFATTTIVAYTTASPKATSTKKKNGAAVLEPHFYDVLGVSIALGLGLLV